MRTELSRLLLLAILCGLPWTLASPTAAAAEVQPATRVLTLPVAGADAAGDAASVQFIGTATVILRLAGFTILTDPNFLHRGEHVHLGYGLKSRRLTEPAMRLEQLPPVDAVLLSHYHGDHFDQRVQEGLDRRIPIVTTQAAVPHLKKLNFERVEGLARWESVELRRGDARLRITAMPGRHGPPLVAAALPDVMGSLVEPLDAQGRPRFRLYISGDTLMHDDLAEVPRRFPGIDMALLHLGGTRVLGVLVTMDAEQGVQAMQLIDPRRAIPIHHDDYDVFKSPLSDFLAAAERAGLRDRVTVLERGGVHRFALPAAGR